MHYQLSLIKIAGITGNCFLLFMFEFEPTRLKLLFRTSSTIFVFESAFVIVIGSMLDLDFESI
jgi:hypothetical protein